MKRPLIFVVALLTVIIPELSAAQDTKSERKYPNLFNQPALPYSGVTLKGGEPPPAPKPPADGLQYITWPGFRTDVGAPSEVFVQLTGPVDYKVKMSKRRVSITINKVKIYKKNTLRRLVTKHFPGPTTLVRLKRLRRNKYRLDISLRKAVTPQVELKQQDKYHYLVVTFPAQS